MSDDGLKEWKLVQGMLGAVAAIALGFYVLSGNFQVREWFPFLPPPPPPDTVVYHADTMRRHFQAKRFSAALSEAEWVLLRDKQNTEAFRTRGACLLRVGRFAEAETAFRALVAKDKKDISARLALATALRGQGDDEKARGVLLRLLRDPSLDTMQHDAVEASLEAIDIREPLFADQPTLPPRRPQPSPQPSPTPEPLTAIAINPPGMSGGTSPFASPAPAIMGVGDHQPTPVPTPEPGVAAVLLPVRPQAAPEPGATTPEAPAPTRPLELPPPSKPEATLLPGEILPATLTLPRRILPTTAPEKPTTAPEKPTRTKKKPSVTRKKPTMVPATPAKQRAKPLAKRPL